MRAARRLSIGRDRAPSLNQSPGHAELMRGASHKRIGLGGTSLSAMGGGPRARLASRSGSFVQHGSPARHRMSTVSDADLDGEEVVVEKLYCVFCASADSAK